MHNKTIEHTKAVYNTIAHHFSQTRTHKWHEFSYFKEYLKEGASVLDIGCGNGRLYTELKTKDITYTGLDLSSAMLEEGKKKFPHLTFVEGNMTHLHFEKESFDAVFMIASLQHLPTHLERCAALKEAKRVLKKDGYLFISNWNLLTFAHRKKIIKGILRTFLHPGKFSWNDFFIPWKNAQREELAIRYYHGFTKHELERIYKEVGLINVTHFYSGSGGKKKQNENLCFILRKA